MKLLKNYNERSQKIERFILKNKIFCLIIVIAVVVMIGGKIKEISELQNKTDISVSEQESDEEKVDTSVNFEEADKEDDGKHWRFYWSDLIVLVAGGGFCSIQIIRERAKAKEKLH